LNRTGRIALLAVAAALFGAAVWSDFPLCPIAGSLGVPCPGCGLTRATLALLHGDWQGALRFHPLVWLLLPVFAGFVGIASWEMLRDTDRSRSASRINWTGRGTTTVALALLVLTFGVWLARFAGYFGGPVPVTSLRAWLAS
jgi:hypothetical protein